MKVRTRRGTTGRRASLAALLLVLGVSVVAVGFGAVTGGAQAGAICLLSCSTTTTTQATTTTTQATTTTTQATTTTSTTPTTSATTSTTTASGGGNSSGPTALDAVFLPCSPTSRGGPCAADPNQVQVSFDPSSKLGGVQLTWVPGSNRPADAPNPTNSSVVLDVSKGQSCAASPAAPAGDVTYCWAWPAGMTHPVTEPGATKPTPWILNGTYQVTGCAAGASGCTASSAYTPSHLGIAVRPLSPASVRTSSADGLVTLKWSASKAPEPDLVGYQVNRSGQSIYVCSTDGAGPGIGHPCPSPLSITDRPGEGQWTYTATALRFGVDPAAANVVASPAVASSIHVLPWAVSTGTVGTAAPYVPPLPSVGTVQTLPLATVPYAAGQSPAATVPNSDNGAFSSSLPYSGDNPALSPPGALAVGSREIAQPKPKKSVVPEASIALGLIALALAAHIWYLRGELAGAAARVAARRAAGDASEAGDSPAGVPGLSGVATSAAGSAVASAPSSPAAAAGAAGATGAAG